MNLLLRWKKQTRTFVDGTEVGRVSPDYTVLPYYPYIIVRRQFELANSAQMNANLLNRTLKKTELYAINVVKFFK